MIPVAQAFRRKVGSLSGVVAVEAVEAVEQEFRPMPVRPGAD